MHRKYRLILLPLFILLSSLFFFNIGYLNNMKNSKLRAITSGFREAIHKNHDVSLRDLYYTISRNTDGSHVKIYNETNYGNVYSNTMGDYFE